MNTLPILRKPDFKVNGAFEEVAREKRMCDVHGKYESVRTRLLGRLTEWTSCEQCEREAADAEERMKQERKYQARLRNAGIPQRFVGKGFAQFRATTSAQEKVLLAMKSYADNFAQHRARGQCLTIVGQPGTGKTHLALAVGQQLLQSSFRARYTTVFDAIQAIRETWRNDSVESEADVIRRLAGVDLLILDEVGVQRGTESEQLELFKILGARYDRMLPTIVISNVPVDDLKHYLGERAWDRLRENGGKLLVFDWGSARGSNDCD